MFELEQATYEAHKAELLAFEGEYVVINGDQILGHYKTATEAEAAGYKAFGLVEHLFVHQIVEVEPTIFITGLFESDGLSRRSAYSATR
jgi:hypothetical protein